MPKLFHNREFALWTGVLAGPILWLFSFQAKFAWAPWACTFQTKLALYLVAFVAVALTAGSGVLAWSQWKELGGSSDIHGEGALPRSRFMALAGMVFAVGFSLVILAQSIPDLILRACE